MAEAAPSIVPGSAGWSPIRRPTGFLAAHAGRANAVAWSWDGRRIATGGDDSAVRLWAADADAPIDLHGHDWPVTAIDFAPRGDRLVSASRDGTLIVWSVEGRALRRLRVGRNPLVGVAWAPDADTICTITSSGASSLWSADDDEPIGRFTVSGLEEATCLSWYRGGGALLAAGGATGMFVFEFSDRLVRDFRDEGAGRVTCCDFSPSGPGLVWGHAGGAVTWLSADDPNEPPIRIMGTGPEPVTAIAFALEGDRVAVGTPNGLSILDLGEPRRQASAEPERSWAESGASAPPTVADATESSPVTETPATTKIWSGDAMAGAPPAAPAASGPGAARLAAGVDVRDLAWSMATGEVAIAAGDGSLVVADPSTGEVSEPIRAHRGRARDVAWRPDGVAVASVGDEGVVLAADDGTRLTSALDGDSTDARCVDWSAAGLLVGFGDGGVGFEAPDGRGTRFPSDGSVNDVRWSHEQDRCAWVTSDGLLTVRRPTAGDDVPLLEVRVVEGGRARAVAWSPDDELLATGDDEGVVRCWDASTGSAVTEMPKQGRAINALSWSDGGMLAVGSSDGSIRLYRRPVDDSDVATDLAPAHGRAVTGLAWAPDGRTLVSCSRDGGIASFDTEGKRTELESVAGGCEGVAWRPDGSGVAIAGSAGAVVVRSLRDASTPDASDDGTQFDSSAAPIGRDAAAVDDELRRERIVTALAAQLQYLVEDEDPGGVSVAVHLGGAWGSGKSSVVNLLAEELNSAGSRWIDVRFDAWRHSRTSPAWWALVTELRDAVIGPTTVRSPARRAWLRLREAGRRLFYFVRPLGIVVGILLAVVAALWFDPTTVLAVASGITAIALAFQRFILWESAAGAQLIQHTDKNPLATVSQHVLWLRRQSPRRAKHGVDGTAPVRTPILFVLDDLDRCEAPYVVDVLETVHTLLRQPDRDRRGGPPAPIVFLAVGDAPWLRRAYERRYEDFEPTISEPGQTLGYLFQEKLFQASLSLGPLTPEQATEFLLARLHAGEAGNRARSAAAGVDREPSSDTPGGSSPEVAAPAAPPADADADARALTDEAATVTDPDRLESLSQAATALIDPEQRSAALRSIERRKLAPEVRERTQRYLLERFGPIVAPNPRGISRLVGAYHLELSLQPPGEDTLPRETVALWTILKLRFPSFVELLTNHLRWRDRSDDDGERLLAALTSGGRSGPAAAPSDELARLSHLPELARVLEFPVGGPLTVGDAKRLAGLSSTRVDEPRGP